MVYSTIIMAKNKKLFIIAAVIVGIALIIALVLIFMSNSDDASTPEATNTSTPETMDKGDAENTNKPEDPAEPPFLGIDDDNPADFQNGVIALDPATIGLAFRYFTVWAGTSWEQIEPTEVGQPLFDKLDQYGNDDFDIHDTYADIQPEAGREKLNDLAAEHGFGRPFEDPFEDDEVGVASIVDKEMFWHKGDATESILTREGEGGSGKLFEAVSFSLTETNEAHFAAYRLPGFAEPVVRVAADPSKSDDVQNYMWITELSSETQLGFNSLFAVVQGAIAAAEPDSGVARESSATIASVIMPQLDQVKYERNLDELIGTQIFREYEVPYEVRKAFQKVRVSVDELGAEAAAITGITTRSDSEEPPDPRENIILGDQGFLLVWFTEGESDLPICIMITNPEAWTEKQPD